LSVVTGQKKPKQMPFERLPEWPRKLAQLITSAREGVPFAWGTFDCAMFCCQWIRELTGTDPGAAYRGKYSTEAEAIAIFGNDLASFAAGVLTPLGAVEVEITYARRGDIVFVDNSTEEHPSPYGALAIVDLDGRYAVCVSATGARLMRLHMKRWKRAWRIG
jgi:hypothetical protein